MKVGRKKRQRVVCIDPNTLICSCVWPLQLSRKALEKLEKVVLYSDELQTLQYKDIDGLTMQQGAERMAISKTVFAWMYKSARKKQADCLIHWKVLLISCDQHP